MKVFKASSLVLACAFATTLSLASHAEVAGSKSARTLITQKIDETKLVTLEGNTRPEAMHAANVKGLVPSGEELDVQLLLKRTPEQELALAKLMDQLHTAGNANYHKWLTPAQFAENFGVSKSDVKSVEEWLTANGLKVVGSTPTGMQIEFKGNVGAISSAFHTEMHFVADRHTGELHIANTSDPKIPAELAKVVIGPTTLNTFPAHNMITKKANLVYDVATHTAKPAEEAGNKGSGKGDAKGDYSIGSGYYVLVPGDIQTIYNIKPLLAAGYTGKGSTIGLVEDTSAYKQADWTTYVSTFGLTSYGGSFTTNAPTGTLTCTTATDVAGADEEAELDIEVATAAAPGANVIIEACKDTTTFGGLIAVENLVNSNNSPKVLSMSYGECEAYSGASLNASFSTAFQQAATEGVTVFVSAGDNGGASCDQASATRTNDEYWSAYGLGVTGWGETPYNVAVGGTDFLDALQGSSATYWSSTNNADYSSALSYIPELPWNDSCASELLSTAEGYPTTYGTAGFCNNSPGNSTTGFEDTVAGGGGYSSCATGTKSVTYVVSGTCAGYAQPSWQTGLIGVPTTVPQMGAIAAKSTAVRTIPDVSLFAANGVYGHYYVICYSNTAVTGGVACTGAPSGWTGIGGTSASSPVMAGIQTIINQYLGSTTNGVGASQGNANYVYYALAKSLYGASGSSACNSSNGTTGTSACVFYDVTQGDTNANCKGAYNCYLPSGTFGAATTTPGSYVPAYKTGVGYDLATGIGTVNAFNLAVGWKNAFPTTTAISSTSTSLTSATSTTLKATVSAATLDNAFSGGTQTAIAGTATFYSGSSSLGSCTLASAACTISVSGSTLGGPGSYTVKAVYNGSVAYPTSTSATTTISVTDASATAVTATPSSISSSGSTSLVATVTDTTSSSFTPTGSVNFTLGATNIGSCTLASGTCSATAAGSSFANGSNTVTATYVPAPAFWTASSNTAMVTITADNTTTAVTATPSSITGSTSTTLKATVSDSTSGSVTPTGTVAFTEGSAQTSLGSCTLAAGTCSISVTGGTLGAGSDSIKATFTPTSAAAFNASSGTTTVTVGADITFSSVSHNFGSVMSGTSTSGSENYGVQLTNNSSSAVSGSVVINGAGFTQYNNCGTSIAAGAHCEIIFTFTPTAAQTYSATWYVTGQPSGALFAPSNGGTLTGTGVASAGVTLTTNKHNFGTQTVGTTSAVFGAVLTNSTSTAITLAVAAPTGNTGSFVTYINNCGTSLAAGASCNLQYEFKPTATGSVSEFIGLSANGGSTTITASGSATAGLTLVGSGQ